MWARTYDVNNVTGVLVSGGMGYKAELVGFDVGDPDVVDLILNRDPAIFDFLIDAVTNIKDIADLMWADEGYFTQAILPRKYEDDLGALRTRVEHLLTVAEKFEASESAVENLHGTLRWLDAQELKQAKKAAAKVVRREYQRDYEKLFMQVGRRDGFCCVVCGTSTDLTIDHKLAVANGGKNDPENLQLMCMTHNREKGVK